MRAETKTVAGRRTEVLRFDSQVEFAEACEALADANKECDRSWTGESWREAIRGCRQGRTDRVRDAEALLEKIQASVDTPRSEWVPEVAGAYPVVPDALADHPASMRRRVEAQDDRAPVRIFVDLLSSAGVGARTLRDRGTAYLALAIALSAERAVELWVTAPWGGCGSDCATGLVAVRVGISPIDVAAACNALTSVGLARGLAWSMCQERVGSGLHNSWHWGWQLRPDDRGRESYVAAEREALGASPHDVVAPPLWGGDVEAVTDPVGFVQRSLGEHRSRVADMS